jgi:hypothetical protein
MATANRLGFEEQSGGAMTQSPRTYNFLLRLSRLLGNVATHASSIYDVRSFMSHDITLPPTNQLLSFRHNNVSLEKTTEKIDKAADLKKIVEQSHETLMSANTVFPITIFPDTVTVDRTKVTITRRDFFWSSDVMSIRIEDVLNVAANVGPLFGSLTIASRVMSTVDHFRINHFWRSDAIRLKQIIQGYVIAQHNKIDTAHLGKKELIETLIELGHDSLS